MLWLLWQSVTVVAVSVFINATGACFYVSTILLNACFLYHCVKLPLIISHIS